MLHTCSSYVALANNALHHNQHTATAQEPNGVVIRDTLTLKSTREIKNVPMKCSIDVPSNISHHIMDQVPIMTVDHPCTPIMPLQKTLNFAFPAPGQPERIQTTWPGSKSTFNCGCRCDLGIVRDVHPSGSLPQTLRQATDDAVLT